MAKLLPLAQGYVSGLVEQAFGVNFRNASDSRLRPDSFNPSDYPILPEDGFDTLSKLSIKKLNLDQFREFLEEYHKMMENNNFSIMENRDIFTRWLHKYGLLLHDTISQVEYQATSRSEFMKYYSVAEGLTFIKGGNQNPIPYYLEANQLFVRMMALQYGERALRETKLDQQAKYIQYLKYWQHIDDQIEKGVFAGQ